jgi:hypothetical protein
MTSEAKHALKEFGLNSMKPDIVYEANNKINDHIRELIDDCGNKHQQLSNIIS